MDGISLGLLIDIVSLAVAVISLVVAIIVFMIESRSNRRATLEQTRIENIRATLTDFQMVRRTHPVKRLRTTDGEERDNLIREYLTDLERFATGVNMDAYDIETVNRMSGGALIFEFKDCIADYIIRKRNAHTITSQSNREKVYIEYEQMIKKLYEMRNLEWRGLQTVSKEQWALEAFLDCPVTSTEEVFAIFRKCGNVVEKHGAGKEGYLYIPGKRKDRCLIVAHADTVRDLAYRDAVNGDEHRVVFGEGRYRSANKDWIIGADDRAGCAMAWLLKDSGHSILILDGEEKGQIGAHYLEDTNPALFQELNQHRFMVQLDRRGASDYKCYNLPVTEAFKRFIEIQTGFELVKDSGRTDICVLCKKICGVNVSVGYGKEHRPEEYLDYKDWLNSYRMVEKMLAKPLKKYPLKRE